MAFSVFPLLGIGTLLFLLAFVLRIFGLTFDRYGMHMFFAALLIFALAMVNDLFLGMNFVNVGGPIGLMWMVLADFAALFIPVLVAGFLFTPKALLYNKDW